MNPLDAVLKDYVTPVMRAAGFKKSGRLYRLRADNGDYAMLDVWSRGINAFGSIAFGLMPCWATVPYVAWRRHLERDNGDEVPGSEYAIRGEMVAPPEEFWEGIGSKPHMELVRQTTLPPEMVARLEGLPPSSDPVWALNPSRGLDSGGKALAQRLESVTVPMLKRLLDRSELLKESELPREVSVLDGTDRREVLGVVLRVDDAPPAEVLAYLETLPHDFESLADWARSRLAARLGEA